MRISGYNEIKCEEALCTIRGIATLVFSIAVFEPGLLLL